MKVRCKIDVSQEEYFNFIVDNVRQEVLKYAHKNNEDFKVEKGFSYVKSLKLKDKKYQTKVIIDECEYPSHYKSTTIVENGKKYSIEYLINDNEVYSVPSTSSWLKSEITGNGSFPLYSSWILVIAL